MPAGLRRQEGRPKHLEYVHQPKNYHSSALLRGPPLQNPRYDRMGLEQKREALAEFALQVDLDLSKRPVQSAHDPIESCAELGAALRPTNGQSNAKRLSAAKPRGSNQKSYYPSKDDRIHPKDFKPLPHTPAKAKLTSWKLGSGFKKREKPNVGKKKNILPIREEIRKPDPTQRPLPSQLADNDIEDRVGEVQESSNTEPQETGQCLPRLSASNEDDRPTVCFTVPKELNPESNGTFQDSQRVGKCRSVFTAGVLTSEQTSHERDIMPSATPTPKPQRQMRQLQGRRKSRQNLLTLPAETMRNGSSIIPPETWSGPSGSPAVSPGKQPIRSDAHQWFTSRAAPLQRGTSFVLRPRVRAKGNLDVGISPRLKRVTSLPFVPPFKATR